MNSIEDRLDTLESVVDEQQAQIEAHEETIAAQQETIDAQRERLAAVENDGGVSMPISRRGALQAGGALGLLGLGTGTASAQSSGQIGTADTPVGTVYLDILNGGITGGSDITDLTGNGLTIDDNNLNVDWIDADGLDNDGTPERVSSRPELILEVANPDNVAAGNIVGGWSDNDIDSFNTGGVIAGGGSNNNANQIPTGTNYGVIGGGQGNSVSGSYGIIPGGENNAAEGDYSFAVGRDATAEHNGAFVVGNSNEDDDFKSQKEDEARFQMNVVANAFELVELQGEAATNNLDEGEGMIYISEGGEEFGEEGDLVYGYNDPDGGIDRVVISSGGD